jgi:hypothetical protein
MLYFFLHFIVVQLSFQVVNSRTPVTVLSRNRSMTTSSRRSFVDRSYVIIIGRITCRIIFIEIFVCCCHFFLVVRM